MKCYIVKLQEFFQISPKCYKAKDFSGHEALIPASQFCGYADNSGTSIAVYLSAWILEKKNLVYSDKKPCFIDPCFDNEYEPAEKEIIIHHTPEYKSPEKEVQADAELVR